MKFIVTYHSPAEAWDQMKDFTPEQMQEGMKPWMEWMSKVGDALIDGGSPLVGGQTIGTDGSVKPSTRLVSGYSILEAENMEAALALCEGHPHLNWYEGCEVEVHQCQPMM